MRRTALGGSAAAFVLLGVIVIIITNNDGTRTRIEVADAAKIGIRPAEGDGAGSDGTDTNPPEPPPEPPETSSPFDAFRREDIPLEALKAAGDGDSERAPESLVGVLGEVTPMHNQTVWSVAFSPDGRWIASGSEDHTIILADGDTARGERVLKGHTGAVSAVVFSRDGQSLISASHDGTIRQWAVHKDSKPEILQSNLGEIRAMAASSDGRFLAAGGTAGVIKLWRWGKWSQPTEICAINGTVTTLDFSADGRMLASGWNEKGPDGNIRLFTTDNGMLKRTWSAHKEYVNRLTFSRDGKHLASTGGGGLFRVWDLPAEKLDWESQHYANYFAVAFHPDGQSKANGASEMSSHALPPKTGGYTYWANCGLFSAVAFNSDGTRLAFGSGNGSVQVLNTKSWEHRNRLAGIITTSQNLRSALTAGQSCRQETIPLCDGGTSSVRWKTKSCGSSIVRLSASRSARTEKSTRQRRSHKVTTNLNREKSGMRRLPSDCSKSPPQQCLGARSSVPMERCLWRLTAEVWFIYGTQDTERSPIDFPQLGISGKADFVRRRSVPTAG